MIIEKCMTSFLEALFWQWDAGTIPSNIPVEINFVSMWCFYHLLYKHLIFIVSRSAYVSYGGLLMRLQGDANNLHGMEIDQHVYLLLKKIAFWTIVVEVYSEPCWTSKMERLGEQWTVFRW